jgi:hypothetical protein
MLGRCRGSRAPSSILPFAAGRSATRQRPADYDEAPHQVTGATATGFQILASRRERRLPHGFGKGVRNGLGSFLFALAVPAGTPLRSDSELAQTAGVA